MLAENQSPSQASKAPPKRKQPASERRGKRLRHASVDLAIPNLNGHREDTPPLPTPETTDHQNSPQNTIDAPVDVSRTSNPLVTSPPTLTPFNADIGLFEYFDPFFGLPAEQMVDMSLPGLKGLTEGFSPLEQFTSSSVDSRQGSRDSEFFLPSDTLGTDQANMGLPSQQREDRPATTSNGLRDYFRTDPADFFLRSSSVPVPKVRRMASAKPPTLVFTETMRTKLMEDLSKRLPPEKLEDFHLPPAIALQKCFRTFVDAFHVHLPIFHLPTMDLERTPSPLVLAMCAIGALYRLERKVAASLYHKADQALSARARHGSILIERTPNLLEDWTRPVPDQMNRYRDSLWTGQTRLLLTMFGSFSGDPEVMSRAIGQIGEFSLVRNQLCCAVE